MGSSVVSPTAVSSLPSALIALAVAVLIIVRQFSTRRLVMSWMILPPLLVGIFGLSGLDTLPEAGYLVLGLNVVLAAALGVVRASTVRLWIGQGGDLFMRGTLVTLALWALTIAVRFGTYAFEQNAGMLRTANSAELLIPVAVTLGVQNLVVYLRSQRLAAFATT